MGKRVSSDEFFISGHVSHRGDSWFKARQRRWQHIVSVLALQVGNAIDSFIRGKLKQKD